MAAPTLLPSGLMDVLPPLAAQEFQLIHRFLSRFMAFGYQPVIPPLIEFADAMFSGANAATSHHAFRVADPLSAQMLALRPDMTGQIARIATTSLASEARPLRLCYAGSTVRTMAEALKSRRQHAQVGIERFGDASANATAEILAIAVQALQAAGLEGLTIDLHYPSVLEPILATYSAADRDAISDAVRLKDHARLNALGADLVAELLRHAGPASQIAPRLEASTNPHVQRAARDLHAVLEALEPYRLDATLTIDLLDLSGYGYYHGVGYGIYWNRTSHEIGRGGVYRAPGDEEAVGFTLYVNDLLDHLATEAALRIKHVPYGTPAAETDALQAQGYVTVFSE